MRREILGLLLLILSQAMAMAQTFSGTVKDNRSRKGLDYVSVVVFDGKKQPICFQHTDEKGRFQIEVNPEKHPSSLSFSCLGYARQVLSAATFNNGQTVYMREAETKLKEVVVKSQRLRQNSDTLIYSVAGFRQKQDRSIADVIAKMPGLEVKDNGTITFQGTAINKFYIEGMDLMGKKYAMASENLSADKVKNVEVLKNHQPIKALKNVEFSNQAALNIVLNDDAKNVWSGRMDVGMGSQLQKADGKTFQRDGKLTAMMFGRKMQNISMYKCNNTGLDIQHEVTSLAQNSDLQDNRSGDWVSEIPIGSSQLDLKRYNFNDTHLFATNWLAKLEKDRNLRLQATFLKDHSLGHIEEQTTYTDVLGMPVVTEETQADKYRNELTTELQYTQNSSKNYLNGMVIWTMDWNHSSAKTELKDGEMLQYVKPHHLFVGEDFKLIHNYDNNRSFTINVLGSYQNQSNLLALLEDGVQKLDHTASSFSASTGFRHKVMGFNISYDASVDYRKESVNQVWQTEQKQTLEQVNGMLMPKISLEILSGFNFSASCNLKLSQVSYLQESRQMFQWSPTLNMSYQLTATTEAKAGYRKTSTLDPFSAIASFPYYSSYMTRMIGIGKIERMSSDLLWGTFAYGNPVNGLFFNLSGNYSGNGNIPVYQSQLLDGQIFQAKATDMRTHTERYFLNGDITKAFALGKLSITIGREMMWYNYQLLISDQLTPYQTKSDQVEFKLSWMPTPLFSLTENSSYNHSKLHNRKDASQDGDGIDFFQHELKLFVMPGNWQMEWRHELYHSNDESMKTSYFSDFMLSYRTKRYEISAQINNLFGTKTFSHHYISSSYIHHTICRLRPREILCKVSFSL